MAYCYRDYEVVEDENVEYYLQIRGKDDIVCVSVEFGCDHFTTFVDKDGAKYTFNDFDYGVLFRCWDSMPNAIEQTHRWEDLEIKKQLNAMKYYRNMIFDLCYKSSTDELKYGDYFQTAYDKVILYLEQK